MSKIINEILTIICDSIPNLSEIKAVRVCMGWGYTGVKLSTGHVGICHSLLDEQTTHLCRIVKQAGKLAGRSAIELAEMAKSWELSESIVGVATLNALSQLILNNEKYLINEENFIDYIKAKVKSTDTISLIGRIEPFIDILKMKAKCLYVFERNPRFLNEYTLPDTAYEEILPNTDIVIITGSSIANKTIERVLELSKKAREIGVVGPSASLVPNPLFKRGVTIIGTIKPINSDKLMQIISEGGGTHQIKSAVKFITIRPKP